MTAKYVITSPKVLFSRFYGIYYIFDIIGLQDWTL